MQILVGKTFGIGNAICAIPMIKALGTLGTVHVLVGDGPDDFGAVDVLKHVSYVHFIHTNFVEQDIEFDVAIMAIPFDGRWKNGVHYKAKRVMDERPRPDPSTFGFSSWQKHEIEYQMENAYALGYKGDVPSPTFLHNTRVYYPNTVFVGTGYKKDAAGFWAKKHWGNENYISLIKKMLEDDRSLQIVMAGNSMDLQATMAPIVRGVSENRLVAHTPTLRRSMELVASCGAYVGNDTGMMHVAAAHGVPTLVMFMMENAWTKSGPWCDRKIVLKCHEILPSPEEVFTAYKELRNGRDLPKEIR